MSQRRHCWKCGSRHPKPTGFKCKRTLPNMNLANIASTIGSTTWSTLGANMTTAGSTYTVTSPSHTVTSFGSTYTTTVVTMATSDTVMSSTHDTVSSFAAGTNTAHTLTTATTTFNFSLPQTVLCTATSTRPSAPMPGLSAFNPSVPFAQGANLGAHSVPATPGQTPGLDPMDLTAALQNLTSAMTSMATQMQVLESTVASNPPPPSPVAGPLHAGVAFPPHSTPMPQQPQGFASAFSAVIPQVTNPIGANASAPAATAAGHPSVTERARQELAAIHMVSGSNSSSAESDDGIPRPKHKRKSHRYKSGRGRTTDDFVVRRVPWSHHGVYKGQARKPAMFDTLFIPEFVFGYLGHTTKPNLPSATQAAMLSHLRELMHDASAYPWEGVRNYHGILLGMMEQNELTWADRPLIQELHLQYARQPSLTHTATRAHPMAVLSLAVISREHYAVFLGHCLFTACPSQGCRPGSPSGRRQLRGR